MRKVLINNISSSSMGLFSKKKKEVKIEALPPLPEIPRFEPRVVENIELPSYEPTMAVIKKEVGEPQIGPSRIDLAIPMRKPSGTIIKKSLIEERHIAEERPELRYSRDEKPVFVKIDKYKDALRMIEDIKSKIEEAEKSISELESIKNTEQKNIESWKSDLNEIKSKLLDIDKKLFEA